MSRKHFNSVDPSVYNADQLRLEAVTACVGFADMLDYSLALNHPHLDSMIVVTSHDDTDTQNVCRKHGAKAVLSDLFTKNDRTFNKGAAINSGLNYFQYHGWRLHLDADIVLPDNFGRILFNHTHLDRSCIYGCDRIDVIGSHELRSAHNHREPQHNGGHFVCPNHHRPTGPRFVDGLNGYLPLGYFQLWHASCQKPYPYSLGSAAHDDTMFSALWPSSHRRVLPTGFVYHLCGCEPRLGENWDGKRQQPLFK